MYSSIGLLNGNLVKTNLFLKAAFENLETHHSRQDGKIATEDQEYPNHRTRVVGSKLQTFSVVVVGPLGWVKLRAVLGSAKYDQSRRKIVSTTKVTRVLRHSLPTKDFNPSWLTQISGFEEEMRGRHSATHRCVIPRGIRHCLIRLRARLSPFR